MFDPVRSSRSRNRSAAASRSRSSIRAIGFAWALLVLAGCEEDGGSILVTNPPDSVELAIVLNSVDLSLTIVPVDSPSARIDVGLAPEGSPVGFSVRGHLAAVPLGVVPAVAVVDLRERRLLTTVALPDGSGATGSAFVDDSIAMVANPALGTVTPVNVLRGVARAEIPVGRFPQGVVAGEPGVFVLNGELGPDYQPAGPATLTRIDPETRRATGALTLSGMNAAFGAFGPDRLLYVVNQGRFFGNDGSLSVVDPSNFQETAHHSGFGDFPGAAAFGPDGLLYVSSFSYGLAIWDPATSSFVRDPGTPIAPGGVPSVSGLGFDSRGRLHTLMPDCQLPSVANRLDASFQVELEIPVGICPIAIAFVTLASP